MKLRLKRVTVMWLVPFVLILLCPIIFNLIAYVSIEDEMIEQTDNYNREMIERKFYTVEELADRVAGTVSDLSHDDQLGDIAELDYPFTAESRFLLSGLSERIQMLDIRRLGIDDIFIYFPRSSYAVGVKAAGRLNAYYRASEIEGVYDEWVKQIIYAPTSGFVTDPANQTAYYRLVVPLKGLYQNENPMIFAAFQSNTILKRAGESAYGQFAIFDAGSQLVASTAGEDAGWILPYLSGDEAYGYRQKNGRESYRVSWKKSPNTGWRYVFMTGESQYRRGIQTSRSVLLLSCLLSVALGGAFIIYILRRNNRSIYELVDELGRRGKQIEKGSDEYRYISKVVIETIKEKEDYESMVLKQNKTFAELLLSRIARGAIDSRSIKQGLEAYHIAFGGDSFLVLLFSIEDYDHIFFEINPDDAEAYRNASFIIRNIVEESLNEAYTAHFFEHEQLMACIVSMREEKPEYKESVAGIIKRSTAFIQENFNIDFVVSISGFHSTLSGIPVCFSEALDAMEYQFVDPELELLDYDALNKRDIEAYYYPLEKEQQIINFICAGDYDRVHQLLDEIMNVNFKEIRLSLKLSRCLVFDIQSTLIKAINETVIAADEDFLDSLNFYERISECETIVRLREVLDDILCEVCAYIAQNKQNKGTEMVENVKAFVEEYYDDPLLNVAAVADHFNVNVSILSYVFKQQEGLGLLHYLTRRRVERAKELLLSSDAVLDEVSAKSGFSNKRTFFRVFSQFEGISPGKYRQAKNG